MGDATHAAIIRRRYEVIRSPSFHNFKTLMFSITLYKPLQYT